MHGNEKVVDAFGIQTKKKRCIVVAISFVVAFLVYELATCGGLIIFTSFEFKKDVSVSSLPSEITYRFSAKAVGASKTKIPLFYAGYADCEEASLQLFLSFDKGAGISRICIDEIKQANTIPSSLPLCQDVANDNKGGVTELTFDVSNRLFETDNHEMSLSGLIHYSDGTTKPLELSLTILPKKRTRVVTGWAYLFDNYLPPTWPTPNAQF